MLPRVSVGGSHFVHLVPASAIDTPTCSYEPHAFGYEVVFICYRGAFTASPIPQRIDRQAARERIALIRRRIWGHFRNDRLPADATIFRPGGPSYGSLCKSLSLVAVASGSVGCDSCCRDR